MAGLNLRGNNATVETVQKQWQQLIRVRNLYLLSCARVPRIVLIILAYCKCIYNIFIFIIHFIFMLSPISVS